MNEISLGGIEMERVLKAFSVLEPREREMVNLRFGLADGQPQKLDDISRRFAVSRERVRQVIKKAQRKLALAFNRENRRIEELKRSKWLEAERLAERL